MGTVHDREVLNHIFNPLLPLSKTSLCEDVPAELNDEEEIMDEKGIRSRALEVEGVDAAEHGNYTKALELFTKAICETPQRASCYNNRAQVYRLQEKVPEAKIDLNNAINLSGGKGRAGVQALCQRGLLALKDKNEERAKADFTLAASQGSRFAKAQLVQMNPYAAMCNKMLKEMMTRVQNGQTME